jgi:threonine/homoserine/homoserine lactone efflux protein
MTVYLIMGITFGFAAAVQPGPMQTFLISRALSHGWRHTLPSACAPIVSDIPVVILVLLVLNHVPARAENILHIAGGIFLFFLAFGAYRSFRHYTLNKTALTQSAGQSFLKAVTVNLLNPNPYIAWSLVMGPLLLKGWREAPGHGLALVAGFYGCMIATTAGIIMVFSAMRMLGTKVSRVLVAVSAVALACFACYQLWLGISGLIAPH